MREFKFGERSSREIEIEGEKYRLTYNESVMRRFEELYNKFIKKMDEKTGEKECEVLARNIVDTMLGSGTFDHIFQKMGCYDIVYELELIIYLMEEFVELKKEFMKSDFIPQNTVPISDEKKKRIESLMGEAVKTENAVMNYVGDSWRTTPFN